MNSNWLHCHTNVIGKVNENTFYNDLLLAAKNNIK